MRSSILLILFFVSVVIRWVTEQSLGFLGMSQANITNVSMVAQYLCIILIGLVFVKYSKLRIYHVLGEVRYLNDVLIGITIGIALMMLTLGLNSLIVLIISLFSIDLAYTYGGFHHGYYFVTMSWSAFAILCISHFVLAAVGEEFLFRGLLFRSMEALYKPIRSILIVSIAFSLLHYGKDMIGAFIFSIVLCVAYMRYGSLFQVIVAHLVYNVLAYIVTYKVEFHYARSAEQISAFSNWIPELVMLAGSVMLLACLAVRSRRTRAVEIRVVRAPAESG